MEEPVIEFANSTHDDLERVQSFLKPFMELNLILPRTSIEMELLLKHSFQARCADEIIGFAAVEIYSKKLAEIQCLAVLEPFRRRGVGRKLVGLCVDRARDQKVYELMAISSSEEMFQACGFDYSLPNQKRAFFIQPMEARDDPGVRND